MVRLNPGDRISCRIKNGEIVGAYQDYDEARTFEVLTAADYGYYVFVPVYWCLKGTVHIDHRAIKKYSINSRFLDEEMIYVNENNICGVVQQFDGMTCTICKEFAAMAAPNQEDQTFVCYSCRQNPYH